MRISQCKVVLFLLWLNFIFKYVDVMCPNTKLIFLYRKFSYFLTFLAKDFGQLKFPYLYSNSVQINTIVVEWNILLVFKVYQ